MRGFRKIMGLTLAFAALALPGAASASGATCPFTINSLMIDTSGDVNGYFSNGGNTYWWFICNLQGTVSVNTGTGAQNITSGACSALFAQMLTARASNQPINFWFISVASCTPSALPPTYSWMSPNYPNNIAF